MPAKPRSLFLFPLVLLLLTVSGCAPRLIQASNTERAGSFAPYSDTLIDGQPVGKYLGRRTAMVLRADDVEVTRTNDYSGTVRFLRNQPGGAGTATAIDSRGYYLTAAHCIPEVPPLLFFYAAGKPQIERPRIVWKGNVERGEPDLALLHVPFVLDAVFEWSSVLQVGEPLLTTGYYMEGKFNLKAQKLAGKIVTFRQKEKGRIPYAWIRHDVPIAQGNSGGPAMDLEGRLAGINVAWEGKLKWTSYTIQQSGGIALRPNLEWLRWMIEQDLAAHSPMAP